MIWDLSNIVIHCILGWADSVGIICDTTFKFGLTRVYIIKISIKNVCNDVQSIKFGLFISIPFVTHTFVLSISIPLSNHTCAIDSV